MDLRAELNNLTVIAAGYTSGLGIRKDGAVVRLNSDLPLPDCGLTNIVALALGGDIDEENLAIRKDGTVVQWHGAFNPEPVPDGLANIQAVAVGRQNRLALKADGTVFAWGDNQYGQITGAPTKAGPHTASGLVTLAGNVLTNVVAIAAGGKYMYGIDHSLALKRDGTVAAWGNFGHHLPASTPAGLTNVVAIAAGGGGGTDSGGGGFCLAITTNPAVFQALADRREGF
jgi:alpha-tubulin suppressor-like RCC1 family protein